MRSLVSRLLGVLRRPRFENEIAEEIAAHLDLAADEHVARGMTAPDARRTAVGRFGGVAQTVEACRRNDGFPLLESIWRDGVYAFRSLRRQPAFSVVALVVLAAVIGLNTSLFTLTTGLLFRPWAGISSPDRVITMYPINAAGRAAGFSMAGARYLSARATSLAGISVLRPEGVDVGIDGPPNKTGAFLVSGNFFNVLGLVMAAGRGFGPDEDRAGAPKAVAVLGHAFWQARFGGDDRIVGRTVRVNDVPFTIVGVAPEGFVGPEPRSANLFLPVAAVSLLHPNDPAIASFLYRADDCCSDLIGRLTPGVTRAQAQAELDVLHRAFLADAGDESRQGRDEGWHIRVGGTEFLSRPGRKNQAFGVFALLSAGLLLVWLIACANIGNLQLARAAARAREIGTRLSLGASRSRVVRQLLVEGFVLALGAAVVGIGIAWVLPKMIVSAVAEGATPFSLTPDAIVLAYAATLAGASTLAFGLAPALHATRADVVKALKSAEGGLGRSGFRLRSVMLGAQIALSVVLLVSAGLLVRGAQRMSSFDPGFSTDVTVVSFDIPAAYDATRMDALVAGLDARLRGARGRSYAWAAREPFALSRDMTVVQAPGVSLAKPSLLLTISPDYFDVLGIPVVAGRRFGDDERAGVMINESLARVHWPNEDPVGRTLLVGSPRGAEQHEVIGVTRDAYTTSATRVDPMVYWPAAHWSRPPVLLIKAGNGVFAADVARIVAQLDPRVAVRTTALADRLSGQTQPFRYGAALAATLGLFALLLATIGTFGVFMYSVRQRTREIGVRVALGARPGSVVRLILAGQSRALLGGLGVGMIGAAGASAVLRDFMLGMSPIDPATYAGVIAVLIAAGLAASCVPARRAARVDPATALRYE